MRDYLEMCADCAIARPSRNPGRPSVCGLLGVAPGSMTLLNEVHLFQIGPGNVSTSVFLVWCRVGFVVNFCLILAVLGLEQASEVLVSFSTHL